MLCLLIEQALDEAVAEASIVVSQCRWNDFQGFSRAGNAVKCSVTPSISRTKTRTQRGSTAFS